MPENAPPVIDHNEPIIVDTERYWRVVHRTVVDVFQGTPRDVEKVRARLDAQPSGTREKFYQTEPYSVAADIAGEKGPGTENQQLDYLRIKEQEKFGPVESPDAASRRVGPRWRGSARWPAHAAPFLRVGSTSEREE
jgi:hypothetical protein